MHLVTCSIDDKKHSVDNTTYLIHRMCMAFPVYHSMTHLRYSIDYNTELLSHKTSPVKKRTCSVGHSTCSIDRGGSGLQPNKASLMNHGIEQILETPNHVQW